MLPCFFWDVMSWNPFTASHSNGKEMNRIRPLICQKVINEIFALPEMPPFGGFAYWKSRSSSCQSNCHDSFALLLFPYHLQITIIQSGILENLKPTEFQREQTSSCFLFLNGWTIGLLLCKPWHTKTFPKQTIICLFLLLCIFDTTSQRDILPLSAFQGEASFPCHVFVTNSHFSSNWYSKPFFSFLKSLCAPAYLW